ncbi:hypothetical protein RRG08_007999 [Elysia crispata]|uniref:Uncharacterized protein n=1 Tax=Elysia crispata TaxID=231223 RepID=A0AAE1B2W8_9GAST|nr:hypothetical protein RRG08_007999 [Elysia crispata]
MRKAYVGTKRQIRHSTSNVLSKAEAHLGKFPFLTGQAVSFSEKASTFMCGSLLRAISSKIHSAGAVITLQNGH